MKNRKKAGGLGPVSDTLVGPVGGDVVTTRRDLDFAASVSMEICAACGWLVLLNHAERCDPERGRAAARLISGVVETVPDVRAGQLGYGPARVVFDVSDDFSVVFEPVVLESGRHAFSVRDFDLLDRLSTEESAALVVALRGWFEVVEAKRRARVVSDQPDR